MHFIDTPIYLSLCNYYLIQVTYSDWGLFTLTIHSLCISWTMISSLSCHLDWHMMDGSSIGCYINDFLTSHSQFQPLDHRTSTSIILCTEYQCFHFFLYIKFYFPSPFFPVYSFDVVNSHLSLTSCYFVHPRIAWYCFYA